MVEISMATQGIKLDGVSNARQLGGYICQDGRRIKKNALFRTGELCELTPEGAKVLAEQYKVKNIIDFRMESERAEAADRDVPGANNIWISVMEMSDYGADIQEVLRAAVELKMDRTQAMLENAKAGFMAKMYDGILLTDRAKCGYSQFFRILLSQEDGAVLWHCSAGKDRAGLASALLLYALGADEEIIMADYMLSSEAYREKAEFMTAFAAANHLDDEAARDAIAMASVFPEYLNRAFDAIKDGYGSIYSYINNALDVTGKDMERLRDRFLDV